ncbi:S-layer homology domain-containing protein [Sphaerospermopsis aphanizomenoides BCCUSP55]|uniref:S-layer homology domain-containing protein n=1 Tax=Sphaerospermopsis aphanizomenoides TaxID=459663 RepID=UPI001902DD65|nr:S-layer homology domain-containing protein [Sphaerospermopsis aphanizomenoides]MBK1989836.1 S-layer homology domain-containing protein [Sphaerospermopsis aphanizomenoides BCCUSP55]
MVISTIYVNPVTGNDTNTGSRLSPVRTITGALKATQSPAIIQLAPGTYSTATGEIFPLIIGGGMLVVGNEANKGQLIIISGSGEYQSPSFGKQNITLLLLGDASLLGVTISNPISKGTGIWIESTSPTLANNTFSKCGREGIFTTGNAKPAILDNLFVQNVASGLMMARYSKGEVLRNVFDNNPVGIAISDFAAPLVANNKLTNNRIAIALSRDASPVLRRNLICKNSQGGLLVNGNAIPDLGKEQDPADNIFRNQGEFDVQNLSTQKLISVGNQLNLTQVKGVVEFITATADTPSQVGISTGFSDLDGHWAAAFVEVLVNKGFISGFPDGTFQPSTPITRAQYAALITKTFQLPESKNLNKFKDVRNDFWAAAAIASAADGGFLGGFPDGTFRPGQNLTKVQAIVSIVNGLKFTGSNPNGLIVYEDRAQIPSYATNAMTVATQKLLVVNYPRTQLLEPLREITRAEVAALIYQALVAKGQMEAIPSAYIVKPDTEIPSFSDLVGHWAEPFIRALVSMNLTQGFADGSYQPDKPMTRAQYAALITAAFNPVSKRQTPEFTDVPADFWAAKAIQQAASGGFVGGFSDRTFRPHQNVQRLQVIVSLVNGLGLPAASTDLLTVYSDRKSIPEYARTAIATATQYKMIVNYPDSTLLAPTKDATRGEVAAMIYQALVALHRVKPIN